MNYHETHLSPFEAQAPTQIWIQSPHENHSRQKSDQAPTKSGSPSPQRLTFPKGKRLLKRSDYLRLSQQKERVVGRYLSIDFRRAPKLKIGITASSKYGPAVQRNRFKRLVREAFRLDSARFPQNLEFNVFPRLYAKEASLKSIRQDMLRLLSSCDKGSCWEKR